MEDGSYFFSFCVVLTHPVTRLSISHLFICMAPKRQYEYLQFMHIGVGKEQHTVDTGLEVVALYQLLQRRV